jgi:hypothetical protein
MCLYSIKKIHEINDKFKPQLVFVGACYSEVIGNAFVNKGVPHVVAIKSIEL